MPLLIALKLKHYSPKDSETGIVTYLIADSFGEAMAYVNRELNGGRYDDQRRDEDEGYASFDSDYFKEHPEKLYEANTLNLKVDEEWGSVKGPAHLITLWHRGDDWEEVSDLFYGATQYNWCDGRQITVEQSLILIDLAIAIDIRTHVGDSV